MEYFVYCRDRPGICDLRWELAEDHWSFMDRYTDALIARGPTLAHDDEEVMTGSMHLVDLPDADAARTFAFSEPYYVAGMFAEVLVRRWSNTLARTMWDFAGDGGRRFLVIAHGNPGATQRRAELHDEQLDYLRTGLYREGLILFGPLLSEDGRDWLGTAMLVELAGRTAAEALVEGSPFARAGLYADVEIHRWRFGGRSQT